jgi:hypothetical protein
MIAPVVHILPIATIRREQLLPVPGRLVVRKGQHVSATDVVAEAIVNPEHIMLDVTRALGVSTAEADRHILCSTGAQVSKDDVLAGPIGLVQRVVRSPCDGQVVVAGSGQILLEVSQPPSQLLAGLSGTIVDLVGDRGVVVETAGAIVQGVWGNGKVDYGLLKVMIQDSGEELEAARLDVTMRGAVVLGGHCNQPELLTSAAEISLRALILTSINVELLPLAETMSYPIIVIQGLGRKAMNIDAFKLLSTNDRRDVVVNAVRWDRYTGERPDVIIELPASGQPAMPRESEMFSTDQRVHIVRAPYAGKVGTLVTLLPGVSLLANGICTKSAQVRLEQGEEVVVPLANLEVIA